MYAVFQSGGKQHRVSEGQTVRLEKLDIATGEAVEFDQILMMLMAKISKSAFLSSMAVRSKLKSLLTVVARKLRLLSFVVVSTTVSSRATVSGSLTLKSPASALKLGERINGTQKGWRLDS